MLIKLQVALLDRIASATRRPDRGLETVEYVLWAAGIILIIGVLIGLVSNKLQEFWNSLDFGSVR